MSIFNGLSIDLEEYFHAENIRHNLPDKLPSRVVDSTNKILTLLEKTNSRATFFVLGQVAKKHPTLIQEIAAAGHEIASHGFHHRLVYQQTAQEFFEDISSAKILLEDLLNKRIHGYRAPNFSITKAAPWGFEQVARAGYQYDSSVFPIYHPRYKNAHHPRLIFQHPNSDLWEIPLATLSFQLLSQSWNLPIAGGAYWRLFPQSYAHWGIKRLNTQELQPAFCYFHPWELDPDQPMAKGLSCLKKYRHYGGQKKFLAKLNFLLKQFNFTTYQDLLTLRTNSVH